MAAMRFADLWVRSSPIPWVDHESGWLTAANLSVELRRGEPPVSGLHAARNPFFSHPLPGEPDKVEWWHLPDALYFNRRPACGHLLIQHSGDVTVPHRIIVWPEAHLSRDNLGDHILRRACSLLLQLRGCLLLHGSAVVRREGALIFMGPSGHGKSGLAGAFLKDGTPVLGDEMTPVERVDGRLMVLPGLPMLDLAYDLLRELGLGGSVDVGGDGDDGKYRVHLAWGSAEHSSHAAVLGEVFQLSPRRGEEDGKSISLTPVSPRDGFLILLANSYNNVLRESEVQRRHLQLMADIINHVKITRLTYHHGRVSPHALRQAVVEHLDGAGGVT